MDSSSADSGASDRSAAHVEFRGVSKSYDGETMVVANLDLRVESGEFFTLLGPSGSGKTTCLMMLAGFETPTTGDILMDGKSVSATPPRDRGIGVVFQNYALFPHLTVGQNLSFPLEIRDVPEDRRTARISEVLDIVRLAGYENRRPGELSGGQQQRVAIARALVFEPKLVLMDEPLGALDRRLRDEMQLEIRQIQRGLGVTVVYVTHDQREAMAMSTRVAVFHDGGIQQVAEPETLYEEPAREFVASFIGDNNILRGRIVRSNAGACEVDTAFGRVNAFPVHLFRLGENAVLAIRPERIGLSRKGLYSNEFEATVEDVMFLGDHLHLEVKLAGDVRLRVKIANIVGHGAVLRGDAVDVGWAVTDCRAFPDEGTTRDRVESSQP